MRAEIHASGTLHIHSETELEAYALSKWAEDNLPNEKDGYFNQRVLIDVSFPVEWNKVKSGGLVREVGGEAT